MKPYREPVAALPRIERRDMIVAERVAMPPISVRLQSPLRQILFATQTIWDTPTTRESVRVNFRKVIACRTAALGFEVYSSDNEELFVPHTCKSKVCSSCGHRATAQWQRDRWCHLFDIRMSVKYSGNSSPDTTTAEKSSSERVHRPIAWRTRV